MIGALARRMFGTANDRLLKSFEKTVDAINALEPELEKLSDDELRARTPALRERIAAGEDLDDALVDAFATVREAAKRTLHQRHFDVQLLGGIVLHRGMISEMKTGEGKTLVSTLAVYLNALEGKGVHVVTVNDYLANRDAAWMGQIYSFLGLTTGCIVHSLTDDQRRQQYACDVTYGTNNEFGFDYLRDNMKFSLEAMVQRPFNFAIVDEVDSILIDEARTPLIISGPTEENSDLYRQADAFIPRLGDDDYEKDEKARAVTLTDSGTETVEAMLREAKLLEGDNLYEIGNVTIVHHINQALRAHKLFSRDTDYIVARPTRSSRGLATTITRRTKRPAPSPLPTAAPRPSRPCCARQSCWRATIFTKSATSPSSTTSTRRCGPTSCSPATPITSSKTTRSLSSTSLPAA